MTWEEIADVSLDTRAASCIPGEMGRSPMVLLGPEVGTWTLQEVVMQIVIFVRNHFPGTSRRVAPGET